jgi:hypothetical protein
VAALLAVSAACRENLSEPPSGGSGPDRDGPAVQLFPGRDTTVDSLGVLTVRALIRDRTAIGRVAFQVLDLPFGFNPVTINDTLADLYYAFALGQFKHRTFRYFVRTTDILDHETVTDTVTVTVR